MRLATPPQGLARAPPTNFEVKSFDASGNPYISVAAVVAAGVDGIISKRELPPPCQVDPATMDEATRAAQDIELLPTTVTAAAEKLKGDKELTTFLGE